MNGLDSDNTFRIYVRRDGSQFVGSCGELQATINGATVAEIVAKARALIAGTVTNQAPKPRIAIRVSPKWVRVVVSSTLDG